MDRRSLILGATLIGAVVISHVLVPGGEFVYDDIIIVQDNPRIRSLANLPEIWTTTYWGEEIEAGLYRPLPLTTFAVEHAVFGDRAWGYRLDNLLLHLGVVILIYLLLQRMGFSRGASYLGAFLFGLHPVHAEVVTSVVGRADLLAAVFLILAVLSHLRYREEGRPVFLIGIGVCCLLGLLSKEVLVCLPPFLVVWDLIHRRESRPERIAYPYLVLVVVFAIYLPLRYVIIGTMGPVDENAVFTGDPLHERFGTMSGVLFDYGWMFLFPVNLAADFPYYPGELPGIDLRSVAGLLILIGLVVAAALNRGKYALPIAIFLFALAPVSNIIILTGVVKAVRLLYIPSIGLAALGGALLLRYRWSAPVILVLLGAINMKTTTYWLENETLWRRSLAIAPGSAKGLYNLGAIHARRGDHEEAERLFLQGLDVREGESGLLLSLGKVYLAQGRLEEAERVLREAIATVPPDARLKEATLRLAEVFARTDRMDQARAQIEELLETWPDYTAAVGDLGTLLIQMGEWGAAVKIFRIYLEREPGHREARVLLGLSLYKSARPVEAIEEYRRIQEVNADLLVKMGDCHLVLEKVDEAIDLYEQAVSLDPSFHAAWNNLGVAYLRASEPAKARDAFMEAAKIAVGMGEKVTAEGNLRQVLAIDETDEEARRLLESLQ